MSNRLLLVVVLMLLLMPSTLVGAEASQEQRAKALSRQAGDKRPEDQLTTKLFGRSLTIGGEYEFEINDRRDFKLDSGEPDDRLKLSTGAEIELLYALADDLYLFTDAKLIYKKDLRVEDGRENSDTAFRRGETWLYQSNLLNGDFGVQVGRQNLKDKREWWWDETLDAIRFHLGQGDKRMEIVLAQELDSRLLDNEDVDPEMKDIFRLMGRAEWKWGERQKLELFYLHQNDHSHTHQSGEVIAEADEDESDAELTWLGLRARGRAKYKPLGRLYYWADAAMVRGREALIDYDDFGDGTRIVDDVEHFNINGWGIDLGVTWLKEKESGPRLTAAYAYGSGDGNPDDDADDAFRQTGLQDNNGKFRGVDRFRYYGELLRPELSNLQIITLALGWPLMSNSSVEIVFHDYRQVEAAPELRDARVSGPLDGQHTEVGQELDFVLGLEEWKHLELELVAAVFESGAAFGEREGEQAWNAIFKLNYNF